jgi:predicted dienelactone hydrolase
MAARWVVRTSTCTLLVALATGFGASTAFRVHTFPFVDQSRSVLLPNGARVPRALRTIVRYTTGRGPHPLVVFAHGFALSPGTYGRLLDAWAVAGYVVAAPIFPLTNSAAPGGPNESDLINHPAT